MPFWIFHRGWGLLGVPVAAAGPVLAFLVLIFVRSLEPYMPAVLGAGFALSGAGLMALGARLARRHDTEVVDAASGVRQRVHGARDSVMFVPMAGWGWIAFLIAALLVLVGS